MSEHQNQTGGDSATGDSAAPKGGAGIEKTPASSDTPRNISGSSVCTKGQIYILD